MKGASKKTQPRSSGGSRLLVYFILAIFAVSIGYYVVLPAISPKQVSTTAPTISLNPSTDISGASSTISGANFSPHENITATFGGAVLHQTNSSTGASYCKTGSKGTFAGCMFWVPNLTPGTYKVAVLAGNKSADANFTVPPYAPPVSTVLVTLTSVGLGLVTQLVTRRVVDLNAERRMRTEVSAFQKEKREATLANDKAKLDKLKKRELAVHQEQLKVQKARFKVTGITFIPLLGVYYLMANFLGGYGVIVAYTPIPLFVGMIAGPTQSGAYFQLSLFWWYFLSSFAFSTLLSKLLHTTP
jgi:uncharacterized membrane protein (DUF106 family)